MFRPKNKKDGKYSRTMHTKPNVALKGNNCLDVVKINVGGRLFMTKRSTLLSTPGTYFARMLQLSDSKEFFIDRNPKNFQRILDYLRSGVFTEEGMSNYAKALLPADLEFYGITLSTLGLSTSFDSQTCGKNLVLTENNMVVTKSSDPSTAGWNSAVLSAQPIEKCSIRVLTGNCVMIGLAPREGFSCDDENYRRTGYFFYTSNGSLYSGIGDVGTRYNDTLNAGDTISIEYDRTKGTISFAGSSGDKRVAFAGVDGPLHLAIELWNHGSAVQILE